MFSVARSDPKRSDCLNESRRGLIQAQPLRTRQLGRGSGSPPVFARPGPVTGEVCPNGAGSVTKRHPGPRGAMPCGRPPGRPLVGRDPPPAAKAHQSPRPLQPHRPGAIPPAEKFFAPRRFSPPNARSLDPPRDQSPGTYSACRRRARVRTAEKNPVRSRQDAHRAPSRRLPRQSTPARRG